MGKTSVLQFIRRESPAHVLPVYINLELAWAEPERKNPWNYIVTEVLKSAGEAVQERLCHQSSSDLERHVLRICGSSNWQYVLLLLDEFHTIIDKSDDPEAILSEFRGYLNNASSRISILLADRYTADELERKTPHDYWAQLTVKTLGPLDLDSTAKAIRTPAEESDVYFLDETVSCIYSWTRGYPYHVQRAAQYIIDSLLEGPWLVALPSDVDRVVSQLVDQDVLFQAGLCRPDRLDVSLHAAIAALLEWHDLLELFPTLRADPDWSSVLEQWGPKKSDLLAGLGEPDSLIRRLVAIGVLAKSATDYEFFSPLLEKWLRKMRDKGKSLLADQRSTSWGILTPSVDGISLSGTDWQRIDAELVQRCRQAKVRPPLRERASSPDDWASLVKESTTKDEFISFLGILHRLFIDEREDKQAIARYPWLTLAYHRARLTRNYLVHSSQRPTSAACDAWDQVCTRALGRACNSEIPRSPEEWRAVQSFLLRTLEIAMRNAVALVG